jgi:hypothetical protein
LRRWLEREALNETDCVARVARPFGPPLDKVYPERSHGSRDSQEGHREYETLDLKWGKDVMRTPVLVDGRDGFSPEECIAAEMVYHGAGKGRKI